MKKKTADWLLSKTLPEQRVMFGNVKIKIKDYETSFLLAKAWVDSVILICDTFIAAYDKVFENRATTEQMNTWFMELLKSDDDKDPIDDAPIFAEIILPAGALKGLYKSFRRKMDFFKSNEAYTRAIGENMMIVADKGTERNINDASPEFKVKTDTNNEVIMSYVRGEFSGAIGQWRLAGTEKWNLGDKSSEPFISFTPEGITLPAKIELQGAYLLKNKQVGKWSPIYTLIIG